MGRPGRKSVTSRAELERVALELFAERGFDATTVDDIADAAGIGRRTFFRYFASKNDVVWGDFDHGLTTLREQLQAGDHTRPLLDELREAIIAFNWVDADQEPWHRARMMLILGVPALQAHSTLRYQAWRTVISDFAAERLGADPDDLLPQVVGYSCLGAALSAYEQWLLRPGTRLPDVLDRAMRSLDGAWSE